MSQPTLNPPDADTIRAAVAAALAEDRAAYDVAVETSVYLAPDACGRGLGRRLYEALFDELDGAGLHGAYGGIALPNDASVRLHEALGFRRVGIYEEVGRKFGRYWSVAWYEKRLRE